MNFDIRQGNALDRLREIPDCSVNCCVTSPPYFGLRDYGTAQWEGGAADCDHKQGRDGAGRADGVVDDRGQRNRDGVGSMGGDCRKCGARRVDDQIGLEPAPEAYITRLVEVFREVRRVLRDDGTCWINIGDSYAANGSNQVPQTKTHIGSGFAGSNRNGQTGCKPKDLIGIPWSLAFALRADGWYLRQDIIWCLSGGTWVYARTQKGDMPMTIKDLSRLKPDTVKLWNGTHWTPLLGMSKSKRDGTEIEIVLRSGERISCTLNHKFPTERGLIEAAHLRLGDVLETTRLPEPEPIRFPSHIEEDAAWFAGLYIAEGSRSQDTIQISGHAKEEYRWERVKRIAESYGGSATRTVHGNSMDIRVYSKILNAVLDELVTGRTARDKGFAPVVWRYSNKFIDSMTRGYLSGDGHWDGKNLRWRLGFTRNYNLERDLRTACARLGWFCVLKLAHATYKGSKRPIFRGEIRFHRGGHHNEKPLSQVVEIRKARCRDVYDLGVADQPHTFALASGVLSHNSKPNPIPESVKDRCTKAHEYIFLLSKAARYWYDADAIAEPCNGFNGSTFTQGKTATARQGLAPIGQGERTEPTERNRRTVWSIASLPTPEAHFATYPIELPELCLKAGCPIDGIVLDPFSGAGTTGLACLKNGRNYIGIELNSAYIEIAHQRARKYYPLLIEVTV